MWVRSSLISAPVVGFYVVTINVGSKCVILMRRSRATDRSVLFCAQSELMTYMSLVLKKAEQRWNNEEEPEKEYGCYVSPVAYDMIQVYNIYLNYKKCTVMILY